MLRRFSDLAIILVAILFGGFMWQANSRISKLEAGAPGSRPQAAARAATGTVSNEGIVIGSDNAPITIVQFTDYQCPFCGKFQNESLPILHDKYIKDGKVRLVVRDMPLGIHPNAPQYAMAAQCGARQPVDRMAFQTALYSKAASTPDSVIAAAASKAGVNLNALNACIADKTYDAVIKADMDAANKLGVTGTPAFVIGATGESVEGRIVYGAFPADTFIAEIDALLKSRAIAAR